MSCVAAAAADSRNGEDAENASTWRCRAYALAMVDGYLAKSILFFLRLGSCSQKRAGMVMSAIVPGAMSAQIRTRCHEGYSIYAKAEGCNHIRMIANMSSATSFHELSLGA
jgi:hypothetical protein